MNLWTWFFGKKPVEISYSQAQIDDLVVNIKKFDAGAIDEYLTKHVDRVYSSWLETNRRKDA